MFPVKIGILSEQQKVKATYRQSNFLTMLFPFVCAGLWLGFLISAVLEIVFLSVYFWKLDWQKAMEEVSDLLLCTEHA